MKTLFEILKEASELGVECAERTFWKYHHQHLIPEGRKILGKGNVVYFSNDTARRIWMIHVLTNMLGLNLSDVSRYSWPQFEERQEIPSLKEIPGEFLLDAKEAYDKARNAAARKFVDQLIESVESHRDNQKRTSTNAPGPPNDLEQPTSNILNVTAFDRETREWFDPEPETLRKPAEKK